MQNLPRYHNRAFAHNYHAPFIYHVILKKHHGAPAFGTVCGDARKPYGTPRCAAIRESTLGKVIAKNILSWARVFPVIQVYQFCVMPDHVHILLRVKEWSELHLDYYVEALKETIRFEFFNCDTDSAGDCPLFERGYCDKPLLKNRSLDALFQYVRENPHRLAMRMQYPRFFQTRRDIHIAGKKCMAYGNLFLLRNPDKEAVKVSRKDTVDIFERKKSNWIEAVCRGSILVSPFISPREREIRSAAESAGAHIILIVHEAFPERYKPAAHDFAECSSGRLLIVALGKPAGTPLTRALCEEMNNLARALSGNHPETNGVEGDG